MALSTDDEGVSRIDLTHEYTRAALDFNLSYLDLKKMARTRSSTASFPAPASGNSRMTSPASTRPVPRNRSAEPTQLPNASPSFSPAKKPPSNGNSNIGTSFLKPASKY